MSAIVCQRAIFLIIGGIALLCTPAPAADPLSKEQSEKLLEEVSEPLPGFEGGIYSFAFSPDGGTLVGVGGPFPGPTAKTAIGEYLIWQTETWEFDRQTQPVPNRWPDPNGQPLHASYLDHGKRLAVVSFDHQMQMFRIDREARNGRSRWIKTRSLSLAKVYSRGRNLRHVKGPAYCSMQVSPDQRWLAFPLRDGQRGSVVELWKVTPTPRKANTEPSLSHHQSLNHTGQIDFDLAFGLGGRILVTVTADASIRFWNPDTGNLERWFSFQDELPEKLRKAEQFDDPRVFRRHVHLAVSPDGNTLAMTCGSLVRLYDLQANRWKTHHHVAQANQDIYFHPGGRWLVSVASKSLPEQNTTSDRLILWSSARLKPELEMELPRGMLRIGRDKMAFSPDGKLMVSGGYTPLRWSFEKLAKAAIVQAKP